MGLLPVVQPARVELRVDWGPSTSQEQALQSEGGLAVPATAKVHRGENSRDDSVDEIISPGTVRSEEQHLLSDLKNIEPPQSSLH